VAPRNWQAVVDEMSNVRKMVHLAARKDMLDVDHIRTVLVREGRKEYEAELGNLALQMGCPGRSGQLTNGPILSDLAEIFQAHAASIANTYNYDLARQINNLYEQNHRGNRHYYAAHLRGWDAIRKELKDPQIDMMTAGVAIAKAQEHFFQMNGDLLAIAVLEPTTAVCPVCQGWIERGEVPAWEAVSSPPPYHVNCPHTWRFKRADKLPTEQCELLWMGA
jgi:hypothetical protein